MKILHTITISKWCHLYGTWNHAQRTVVRGRKLTFAGIERMMNKGCAEYAADPELNVIKVETAILAR